MSSFPMVDIVWFSQKRTQILLSILEGPKTNEELAQELDLDIRALQLPIKELKESGLLIHENGTSFLSDLGRIISSSAKPAYQLTGLFQNNIEYWTSRHLTDIPRPFTRRLGELGKCELLKQDMNHMFQLPQQITLSASKTKHIISVLSFFYPEHLHMYNISVKEGNKISLVVTKGVYQTMMDNFEKLLNDIMIQGNTEIYCLTEDISPPSFTITDTALLISFFNKNKRYDHQDMLSNEKSALKWGMDLFNYYKDNASIK